MSGELESSHAIEREKWDAMAQGQAEDAKRLLPHPDFESYLADSRTFEGAAGFLGDLRGKRVLDYGSGVGMTAALLAKSGARVTGFDISPSSVAVAQKRAELNGLDIEFVVAAGEDLPFPDEAFDAVVGKAILHHLDVAVAGPELRRVVQPGGKALFSEPLRTNPVVQFARDHLPYRDKTPRGTDIPLSYQDIERWGEGFRHVDVHEIQLLSMIERAFGWEARFEGLRRLDRRLLKRFPSLRRYCRYAVIRMEK